MASRASGGHGRESDYVEPTFNENERNTYLFRSLFLFAYIGIGIDIVQIFGYQWNKKFSFRIFFIG
jgi:hypothetical protein